MLAVLLVFGLAAAVDVAYVFWMAWSERCRTHRAALASAVIGALNVLGTVFVVDDPRLIVVDLLGLYAGTWLAIWLRGALARRRACRLPVARLVTVRAPGAARGRPEARMDPAGFRDFRTSGARTARAA